MRGTDPLALDRAFEDEANVQIAPDLRTSVGRLLVDLGRGPGDDIEAGLAGQVSDDVLGQAVYRAVRRLVGGKGRERQDGDRGALGNRGAVRARPEPDTSREGEHEQDSQCHRTQQSAALPR